MLGKPAQPLLGLREQPCTLLDEAIANTATLFVLLLGQDLPQQPRNVEPVPQAQQRRAIRALGIDDPVHDRLPQRRKCFADRAAGSNAEALLRSPYTTESRPELLGMACDGAKYLSWWQRAITTRLARTMNVGIVLALCEFAA